jgi:hypothetical protein
LLPSYRRLSPAARRRLAIVTSACLADSVVFSAGLVSVATAPLFSVLRCRSLVIVASSFLDSRLCDRRLDFVAHLRTAVVFRSGRRRVPLVHGDDRASEASGASRGGCGFSGYGGARARGRGTRGGFGGGGGCCPYGPLLGTPWLPGVAGGCAYAAARTCSETPDSVFGFFRGVSPAFSAADASAANAVRAASTVSAVSNSVSVSCA